MKKKQQPIANACESLQNDLLCIVDELELPDEIRDNMCEAVIKHMNNLNKEMIDRSICPLDERGRIVNSYITDEGNSVTTRRFPDGHGYIAIQEKYIFAQGGDWGQFQMSRPYNNRITLEQAVNDCKHVFREGYNVNEFKIVDKRQLPVRMA